jgi:hypothetical protein
MLARTIRRFGRASLMVLGLLMCPSSGALAQQLAWEQWLHVPGIVDLGARADGSLVAMAAGRLLLVAADGTPTPFAVGPDGFSGSPDAEPYFVVAPALGVDTAGCAWSADDLFVLDLGSPPGLVRVDPAGHATHFATLAGADMLGGIALDTVGSFGHRLLASGTRGDHSVVFAVDCQGTASTITDSAPPMEGGLAVAPTTFGQFAGDLIAPDENSGQVWAIDPAGRVAVVAMPNLPTGGDTGVESLGFVPPGFSSAGVAYLSDRGTPDNPFPGTDSILRLRSASLAAASVQEGDLLISTEGGGTTVAVHCAATCTVTQVAQGTPGGHIEGHLLLLADTAVR